MKLTEKLH